MISSWESMLDRWDRAGLLDAATAERIRQWESVQRPSGTPNRLAAVAFGFGGLLLIAGALLFVSAHWDALSAAARFALVLAMVGVFHLTAALSGLRSKPLATTLHAAGTGALGAGIFLAGQIFNMAEHWPGALLLWSLGAALGLVLLRDWPHVLWVGVLVPAWLWGEWVEDLGHANGLWHHAAPAVGTVLLALAYLSAASRMEDATWRRALSRLGALAIIPAAILLAATGESRYQASSAVAAPLLSDALAWFVALVVPSVLAFVLIGKRALYLVLALAWCLVTIQFRWGRDSDTLALFGIYALGAVALSGWGAREQRALVVNVGVLAFALTTLGFYFSSVSDKLGRSLSLIVGGILFLAGGWLLERLRRHLIAGMREVGV